MNPDLLIVAALLLIIAGQIAQFILRRSIDRDQAREKAAVLAGATLQHNIACGTGEWPHAGRCGPKITDPEGSMVAFMMLAQSSVQGVGRLPLFIEDMMAIPGPIKFEEAGRCAGDD